MSASATTLAESYQLCRRLNRRHGTSYYWSTVLLPRWKHRYVHALYGFCRYADDIVDDMGPAPVAERARALEDFGNRFFADLEGGGSEDVVLAAVIDTTARFGIDPSCFRRFLRSMALDLTNTSYETWADLCDYMDGSAAVVGEMMLPLLEPSSPDAAEPARSLGLAFQLTNFLRDVGEDLDRHRVYLPAEDLAAFGVDPWQRQVNDAWRGLMAFEIDRARRLYADADRGAAMLPPRSARCVRTARVVYSKILERIEANDYDVFSMRARVPTPVKLALVAAGTIGQRNPNGAAPLR